MFKQGSSSKKAYLHRMQITLESVRIITDFLLICSIAILAFLFFFFLDYVVSRLIYKTSSRDFYLFRSQPVKIKCTWGLILWCWTWIPRTLMTKSMGLEKDVEFLLDFTFQNCFPFSFVLINVFDNAQMHFLLCGIPRLSYIIGKCTSVI